MNLDTSEGQINELLDIIVYAAAGVILLQESQSPLFKERRKK
jgi:hypothetical protein